MAIAQNGLTYADSHFDEERYDQVQQVAAEMMDTMMSFFIVLFLSLLAIHLLPIPVLHVKSLIVWIIPKVAVDFI